ncbi:ATP-binding protein [Phenylobacterium sp.]|uniref:ATP-binding protein n=1 Tax=Phenylobacterium sp. TaxID=1871053 RepID=UPI002E33CAB2|nr:ATP-binding protein [Phenylobacterium sp.]HEX3364467.1 ATP-binding protein [Phenylobacterium sp.]
MRSLVSMQPQSQTAAPANEGQASAAERLDALRRMSGALTHDFNNLLGVIVSANERLAAELEEGSEAQRLALLALEAAERGAELLRRTLALGHEPAPQPDPIDCAQAMQAVRRMARQAIAADVRVKVCLPPQPLHCRGDRTGLEMALLNLCLNAGHATPAGGSINVDARQVRLDRSDRLGLTAGDYIALTVRDTGSGMSPEILARAADPLFTTKATGTGLGLSSVRDFAAAAGGALSLWSREGHGTTATLYLPVAEAAQSAAAA